MKLEELERVISPKTFSDYTLELLAETGDVLTSIQLDEKSAAEAKNGIDKITPSIKPIIAPTVPNNKYEMLYSLRRFSISLIPAIIQSTKINEITKKINAPMILLVIGLFNHSFVP